MALTRIPQEIYERIFRVLILQDNSLDENAIRPSDTLSALARTCRLFYEPALSILWHSIPDIALLLYTLPREAFLVQTHLKLDERHRVLEHTKTLVASISSFNSV